MLSLVNEFVLVFPIMHLLRRQISKTFLLYADVNVTASRQKYSIIPEICIGDNRRYKMISKIMARSML